MLCIDKASTYRRFDIVIRQWLRTLVVSEGAEVATWNEFSLRVVKAILYKRVCFVNKLSLSHWYDDVFKTLLFRWFSIGFAPFIQAENFSHPLSRQRIIVIIHYNSLP